MAQVGARVASAARAAAALGVDGARVVAVARLLDDQRAAPRERLAVARVARRQHAVEHVDARADRDEEIARRADPHEVARPLRVEVRRHLGQGCVHRLDGLADREAAEREAVERERAELVGVRAPEVDVRAPLHDAEHGLPLASRREAARGPAGRLRHRALDLVARRAAGRAHVELHRDVRAEQPLHAHRLLRRERAPRAVEVRAEDEAVLGDRAAVGHRERLEAARVGEHRVRPAREAMQPTERVDQLGARAQPQVVGVAEHDARAGRRDLAGRERLDAALRADGHERGRGHVAVRRGEHARARVGVLAEHAPREAGGARAAHAASVAREGIHMASPYE